MERRVRGWQSGEELQVAAEPPVKLGQGVLTAARLPRTPPGGSLHYLTPSEEPVNGAAPGDAACVELPVWHASLTTGSARLAASPQPQAVSALPSQSKLCHPQTATAFYIL